MPEISRLAPSPTGALHLGNARTFLINWALARRHGWRLLLRIEDLDGPRIKPESERQCIQLLEWLGIDWDEGPTRQSDDLTPYADAMTRLARQGLVYPSELSRAAIEAAASAPHGEPGAGSGEVRFPPELRPAERPSRFHDSGANWRFVMPEGPTAFDDAFAGPQSIDAGASIGDMVVWTRRGTPAYQLAVVVDDARQGVTQVVRGADLLDSAARQIHLYDALGLTPRPTYTHLPLVVGPDGRRLAKRHGDTRLLKYQSLGIGPERVIGAIAATCGLARVPMDAATFGERLDLSRLPAEPSVFRPEDESWITSEH